jgi:hypothetical protein
MGHRWEDATDSVGNKAFLCKKCGRMTDIKYGPNYHVFLPMDLEYEVVERLGENYKNRMFTCEEIIAIRVMIE